MFVDYDLGDYIKLDVEGVETKYRIYGIQLNWTSDGYADVIVELNTILYSHEIELDRDLNWLLDQWETAHDSDLLEVSFWAALGGPENDIQRINDILVVGDKVYIAGAFNKIGGVYSGGAIEFDILTGTFVSLDGGTGASATPAPLPAYDYGECMTLVSDGTYIYIGGYFTIFGGVTKCH